MRVAASVGVVACHAFSAAHAGHDLIYGGVAIFYLMTALLVWVLTDGLRINVAGFLFNRFTRIVPVYWAITIAFALLAPVYPSVFWSGRSNLGQVVMSLLFIPHLNAFGHPWPVVLQGWTLELDMLFYVIFGLTLMIPHRRVRMLVLLAVFLGLPLAGAIWRPQGLILQTYTQPLQISFALGLLMGEAWLRNRLPPRAAGAALLALSLGAFTLFAFRPPPAALSEAAWLAAPFALCLGALSMEKGGWVSKSLVLKELADTSYCVYLLHTVAIGVVFYVLHAWIGLQIAAALGLSFILGKIAYEGFERPLNRMLQRFEREHGALARVRETPSPAATLPDKAAA